MVPKVGLKARSARKYTVLKVWNAVWQTHIVRIDGVSIPMVLREKIWSDPSFAIGHGRMYVYAEGDYQLAMELELGDIFDWRYTGHVYLKGQ